MSMSYFLYAGSCLIDEIDISSLDAEFFSDFSSLKNKLSAAANDALLLISESEFCHESFDGLKACSDIIVDEVRSKWEV